MVGAAPRTATAGGPGNGEDPAQAESRFTFAQTYVGLNLSLVPRTGVVDLTPDADGGTLELPAMFAPRIVLGGLHFWAHADMYVAFSPLWLRGRQPEGQTTRYSLNVETGLKIYPWALSPGTLRPFAGVAWSVNSYRQNDGPTLTVHQMPVMIGAAWRTRWGTFEAGASLHLFGDGNYALRDGHAQLDPQIVDLWLGYKYVFDTTSSAIEASRSGRLADRYAAFAQAGKLSGWELALGPSAAFPFSKSEFADDGAFLSGLRRPSFVPDASVGYYFHGLDAVVRANYRFFYARDDGYDRTHTYIRHSVSLDAFKYIVDYNGFLPFIGGGVSAERLSYEVEASTESFVASAWKPALSIVFGWDIRPYETSSWILRTNLRFTPTLDLRRGRESVGFDHVEFNFIQLVLYPERWF